MSTLPDISERVYTAKGPLVLERGHCLRLFHSDEEAEVVVRLLNSAYLQGRWDSIQAWQESLNKAQYKVKGAVNA